MFYGFFSLKSAISLCRNMPVQPSPSQYGSIYKTPDGDEVLVLAVYEDPEGKSYKWEDKVCLGLLGKWVRSATFLELLERIPKTCL